MAHQTRMNRAAIYWPAALSLIFLAIYIWSMQRFFDGDIPGMEYVLSLWAALIGTPAGGIYFVWALLVNRKKPLNNLHDHLRSAALTSLFGGITLTASFMGFMVTV